MAFGTQVVSTKPFDRKVVEEWGIPAPKRKQKGIDGLELLRSRVLAFHDGHRKVETSRDLYPPTKEIWQVPAGFDASDAAAAGGGHAEAEEEAKPQAQL